MAQMLKGLPAVRETGFDPYLERKTGGRDKWGRLGFHQGLWAGPTSHHLSPPLLWTQSALSPTGGGPGLPGWGFRQPRFLVAHLPLKLGLRRGRRRGPGAGATRPGSEGGRASLGRAAGRVGRAPRGGGAGGRERGAAAGAGRGA